MHDWYGNEDAGDLSMMGAADYSGHLGELMADAHAAGDHEDDPDPDCPDCEEEEGADCPDYLWGEDGGYWGVGAE